MHFHVQCAAAAKAMAAAAASTTTIAVATTRGKKLTHIENDYLVSRNLLEDDFQHNIQYLFELAACIGTHWALVVNIDFFTQPGHCLIWTHQTTKPREYSKRKPPTNTALFFHIHIFSAFWAKQNKHTEICYGCCFCYATAFSTTICSVDYVDDDNNDNDTAGVECSLLFLLLPATLIIFDSSANIKWWNSICMIRFLFENEIQRNDEKESTTSDRNVEVASIEHTIFIDQIHCVAISTIDTTNSLYVSLSLFCIQSISIPQPR